MVDFSKIRNIIASSENSYRTVNLNKSGEDFGELNRSTYSVLKRDVVNYAWNTEGTSVNVTNAIIASENDPSQFMEIEGKKLCQIPGVGIMRAYNELGNPSCGCRTFHMIG